MITEERLMNQSIENSQRSKSEKSESNCRKITIPSIPQAYYFDSGTYSVRILQDYITKKDYDNIINKASRIFGDCLLDKKANDKFFIPLRTKVLSGISCLCLVLYVLFFYLCQKDNDDNGIIYFTFSLISIGLGVGIVLFQSYSNFFRKPRTHVTLGDIMKKKLEKYFSEVNQALSVKGINNIVFSYNSTDRSIDCQVFSSAFNNSTSKVSYNEISNPEIQNEVINTQD